MEDIQRAGLPVETVEDAGVVATAVVATYATSSSVFDETEPTAAKGRGPSALSSSLIVKKLVWMQILAHLT